MSIAMRRGGGRKTKPLPKGLVLAKRGGSHGTLGQSKGDSTAKHKQKAGQRKRFPNFSSKRGF